MEFKEFKVLFQSHVAEMLQTPTTLFVTDTDKETLWDLYLDSFPKGSNEIFRERREFDCSCCRHFIKTFGNVVSIETDGLVSIWDFETGDSVYQTVIDALAVYVKSVRVRDVFVTKESGFGTDKNFEQLDDAVHTWEHFRVDLPGKFVSSSSLSEASIAGGFRDVKNVFKRSLDEISEDAVDTILDLISQKSLYKGEEWQSVLTKFLDLHKVYHDLPDESKDCFCWKTSVEVGGVIGKIRNHSIGVLLTDITEGKDLNEAVRRYESIVAPTNYKRPKAIFTKKMVEKAQKTLSDLGLLDSLGRRFATVEDITVNNILFANKDTLKQMDGDIFTELQDEAVGKMKSFDRVEEMTIDHFMENVLPRSTGVEVYLENRHISNMVSVISPKVTDSASLFKWDNRFSWAYSGNITDSMKQRVKAAGGNVEGVLRFSPQWNEYADNVNDYDAHCREPGGNHIWFSDMKNQRTTGVLDVDIMHPNPTQVAVENITWSRLDKMREGVYTFSVHNYSHRGGRSGFTAEIEYNGQIYSYEYRKNLSQDEEVIVAKLKFSREKGIEFIESLASSLSSKTVWALQTNQFHPVSVCMFSPNYWDGQAGIGHRHYFFILKGCLNDERPNGFFNEFLREDFMEHKHVFEALGGKMRVDNSDDQLSGVGFSTTKRNSIICKVEGSIKRTLKVTF